MSGAEDKIKLRQMECEQELIWEWSHEEISPNIRAYYKPYTPETSGCKFTVVSFLSCDMGLEDVWEDPEVEVELFCRGVIMWDGLRHVWFGDQGYFNYLRPGEMCLVMNYIRRLEETFCPAHGLPEEETK